MNIEQLHNYVIGLGEVEDSQPFGPDNLVYKVKGKIFIIISADEIPLRFNVKCKPELALELREQFSCVLPGYHMNKKHWNTIVVDGQLSTNQLKKIIQHSYNLVIEKKK